MADQNADAKADSPVINQGGLGASSASDGPQYSRDSHNIIDTVDVKDDEAGGKGAEDADKGPDKGKEGDGSDKAKGEEARYDKDPAWQRIMKERDEAREAQIRAEAKLEALSEKGGKGEGEEGGDGHKPIFTYEDVTKWDDDTIREKLEDNPKGFIVNLFSQIVDETVKVMESRSAQNAQKSTIQGTFEKFAKDNPGDEEAGLKGFDALWKSGEVQQFMKANPGHNAMSAYLVMTAEARAKSVETRAEKTAREKAEKAAEEARRNKQAKDGARSLGAGPGGAPSRDANAELKNTKERGGLVSTLAQRLSSRRSAGG